MLTWLNNLNTGPKFRWRLNSGLFVVIQMVRQVVWFGFDIWRQNCPFFRCFRFCMSSIQLFFCGKLSGRDAPTWRHFACSCKNEDLGYCGKGFRVKERVIFECARGKKKVSVLENEVNIRVLLVKKNNGMQNDFMSVRLCLTTFRKKTIVYY